MRGRLVTISFYTASGLPPVAAVCDRRLFLRQRPALIERRYSPVGEGGNKTTCAAARINPCPFASRMVGAIHESPGGGISATTTMGAIHELPLRTVAPAWAGMQGAAGLSHHRNPAVIDAATSRVEELRENEQSRSLASLGMTSRERAGSAGLFFKRFGRGGTGANQDSPPGDRFRV